jgi:hypothetical protein
LFLKQPQQVRDERAAAGPRSGAASAAIRSARICRNLDSGIQSPELMTGMTAAVSA